MQDEDWQAKTRLLSLRERRARGILGVSDFASKEEIKRAWRRETLKHHPDHHGDSAESHRRFLLIHCAYRYLIDRGGCKELDSVNLPDEELLDEKYRLDNLWGYFLWWRDRYFE